MNRVAIGIGVLCLSLGRALAQTADDPAAAVAQTAEAERRGAEEAQATVRKIYGSGGSAQPAAPPASAIGADGAPVGNSAAQPAGAAVAPAIAPVAAIGPDGIPAGAPPAEGTVDPAAELADRGRDPFRPFTLSLRPVADDDEILTPLQRYELAQLRLAGVVLEMTPPRAMLQDNSGMGFIVTPGTPIGRRRGVVKTIEPRRIVIEEHGLDYYGREQVSQVVIEMANDEKQQPQSATQE